MKYMEACSSAREDRESSFHRCGGFVRFVHALDATAQLKRFTKPFA